MAFTLTTLQTEVQARGFDYASTTRLNYWINTAYRRICEADDWIWLRQTYTNTIPTAPTFRAIISVVNTDTGTVLTGLDERTIIDTIDPDLTTTGNAQYYYRTADSGLAVYPADPTSAFLITYIRVPSEMTVGFDVPLIPARYQYLIVDGAVIEALKDSDNLQEAGPLETNFQNSIQEMRNSYAVYNLHDPQFQAVTAQDF